MPTAIPWLPEYSVGHPTLDRQHHHLLDLLNDLADCAGQSGSGADSRFHEILNDLAVYAREHFVTEENLLRQYHYDDLAAQQEEHATYEAQLTDIVTDAAFGKLEKGLLLHFLKSWWLEHILVSDMRYRSLFVAG